MFNPNITRQHCKDLCDYLNLSGDPLDLMHAEVTLLLHHIDVVTYTFLAQYQFWQFKPTAQDDKLVFLPKPVTLPEIAPEIKPSALHSLGNTSFQQYITDLQNNYAFMFLPEVEPPWEYKEINQYHPRKLVIASKNLFYKNSPFPEGLSLNKLKKQVYYQDGLFWLRLKDFSIPWSYYLWLDDCLDFYAGTYMQKLSRQSTVYAKYGKRCKIDGI